jgi:hypothetical protein
MTDYSKLSTFIRNGGAYDRGRADSYYRRQYDPHYFVGGTNAPTRIGEADMSRTDIAAYNQGYNDNEKSGNRKQRYSN